MNIIHVIFALLAAARLVEIVTEDVIFARVRSRWPSAFWSCTRCVSVWTGIVATVVYVYAPFLNWPLALSWLYLLYAALWNRATLLSPGMRHVVISVDQAGNIYVKRNDLQAPVLKAALERLLPAIH